MFCPNYKNKEVFDGFNEVVKAFGGRPMTEEEFRDSALRNQRTGSDYVAMETAYQLYHKNGGNFLDYTPDGKTSILFQSLLEHFNGDRSLAIQAKSRVYSDAFIAWFGDWKNDPTNASKVVDENGEPRVMYHGSPNLFDTFNYNFFGITDPGDNGRGFYFAYRKETAEGYGDNIYSVFLNIKHPFIHTGFDTQSKIKGFNRDYNPTNREMLQKRIDSIYRKIELDKEALEEYKEDEFHTSLLNKRISYNQTLLNSLQQELSTKSKDYLDSKLYDTLDEYDGVMEQDEYYQIVVRNSNQIKSATGNVGTFSTEDNNIYHMEINDEIISDIQNQLQPATPISTFGSDIVQRLLNGEVVSSKDLLNGMLSTNSISDVNVSLCNLLAKHDIPVVLDKSIKRNVLAETITDKNGGSIITINSTLLSNVSKHYAGITIMHEIIHAVTVDAINNPKTEEEKRFARANSKAFKQFRKMFSDTPSVFNNMYNATYALNNEKEFASVFITDPKVRSFFYQLVQQEDLKNKNNISSILKNFINSIVKLFVNKNVFKSNLEQLNDYENIFNEYLANHFAVEHGNIKDTSSLISIYKQSSNLQDTQDIIDGIKNVSRYLDNLDINYYKWFVGNKPTSVSTDEIKLPTYQQIVDMLKVRINAIRTSNLDEKDKATLITITQGQIDMFSNKSTTKYTAIMSTMSQIVPQILQDLENIRSIKDAGMTIDSSTYMYQMHSNVGMYNQVAVSLLQMLNNNPNVVELINEYNNSDKQGSDISINDINEIKEDVSNLVSITEEGKKVLELMLKKNVAQTIRNQAEKAGSIEGLEYVENVVEQFGVDDNPIFSEDISSFEKWAGSMDSSTNEAIRAMSHMINNALDVAHEKTLSKAVELIAAKQKLGIGESVDDLYETVNGVKTGYLVRNLNFGKFYQDYDAAMVEINQAISKKYKIQLEDDNRMVPEEEDARIEWNQLRNKWLNDHCHRKYNKRYYEAWAKVPQAAKDALDSYNSQINSILQKPGVIDVDGHIRLDKLSDEEYDRYRQLQVEKRLLRSDRDIYGNLKQENDTPWIIAKALQQLQIDLYGEEQKEIKKDKQAWLRALNQKIEECGGKEAYEKYKNKEKNHGFDYEALQKWHKRNSRSVFRKDEGHDVFKAIEEAIHEGKPNYGPEYEAISKEIKLLLRPYRDQTGDVAVDIPESVRNTLIELYSKQSDIRKEIMENNPGLREQAAKYKKAFDDFIEFEDTEYFTEVKRQIGLQAGDDIILYEALLDDYGTFKIDYETGMDLGLQPYRWLQHMVAVDKETYMEYEPGDGWIDKVDNDELINSEFDPSYESTMVPKESLYRNEQWDKIEKSKSLMNLYNLVKQTMEEANSMQTNRTYTDDYLLPQVTGSSARRLVRTLRNKGPWEFIKLLFRIPLETIGFVEAPDSYVGYRGGGQELDTQDRLGKQNVYKKSEVVGKYPDGRQYNSIPQYYTRKLEDPSQISSDLINMVISYYNMSATYSEKLKIKDDCEAIVDWMERSKFDVGEKSLKNGKDSNTYQYASTMLEMHLYGVMRQKFKLSKYIEINQTFATIKQFTTAKNLGLNPKVAAVGFLTSQYQHLINAIVGQRYGKRDAAMAMLDVVERVVVRNLLGARYVGNHLSKDLMMVCAEFFNISDQAQKKYEHTNRNRILQSISGNSVFGMLSSLDFLSKSSIMISVLKSYRFVDGEFITKDDVKMDKAAMSDYEYKQKLNKFKLFRRHSTPSLWSCLYVTKEGKLECKDEYKEAWNKCKYVVKNRIVKFSEDADGMATPMQRAAMSQTWLGAFVLIHRQYLPLMLQSAYGKRVYDYDTHQYKNGRFRLLLQFMNELMQNSLLSGVPASMLIGSAFGGPAGAALGASIAVVQRIIGAYKHKKNHIKSKTTKQIIKERFYDSSSIKSHHDSQTNKYQLKQMFFEILLYNALIAPAVSIFCKYADDSDDWWIQMLAYWFRAFQWESYTAYRLDDLFNNIRSVTAAESVIDGVEQAVGSLSHFISPRETLIYSTLFEPSQEFYDEEDKQDDIITRGAYEGWTKTKRNWFKLTPAHNILEQVRNSKAKRKYLENQIMRQND